MAVQYLFLMGAINMPLIFFFSRLVIAVPVIIIGVFHITKIAHICCIILEDSAPALIIIVISSTII